MPGEVGVVSLGGTSEILEPKDGGLAGDHWREEFELGFGFGMGCRESSIIFWIANAWSSSGELLDFIELTGTPMRFSLE